MRISIGGFNVGIGADDAYYEKSEHVEKYDDIRRASPGGQYIHARERAWLDAFFDTYEVIEWEDAEPLADLSVLDCAGGTGWVTRYLEEHGADVTYLDASGEMLGAAREQADEQGYSTDTYLRGDATRLPFQDDAFDYTVSVRSAHVIPEERFPAYVHEIGRVASEAVFFDTFIHPSLRSTYNWALPMESTLYRDRDVAETIRDTVGATLDEHRSEFVLPYASYLATGNSRLLRPLTPIVTTTNDVLERVPGADRFSSVSVWHLDADADE